MATMEPRGLPIRRCRCSVVFAAKHACTVSQLDACEPRPCHRPSGHRPKHFSNCRLALPADLIQLIAVNPPRRRTALAGAAFAWHAGGGCARRRSENDNVGAISRFEGSEQTLVVQAISQS